MGGSFEPPKPPLPPGDGHDNWLPTASIVNVADYNTDWTDLLTKLTYKTTYTHVGWEWASQGLLKLHWSDGCWRHPSDRVSKQQVSVLVWGLASSSRAWLSTPIISEWYSREGPTMKTECWPGLRVSKRGFGRTQPAGEFWDDFWKIINSLQNEPPRIPFTIC